MYYRLPPDLIVGQDYTAAADVPTNWGMAACYVDVLRAYSRGKGVRVGIVDTGIDPGHEQFRSGRIVAMRSFTGEAVNDGHGHGSHVAGTIGGDDPRIGVAQECELVVAKALSNRGSGRSDQIGAAFQWCADQGCHIISASIGGPSPDQWSQKALGDYAAKGGWPVIAAGNERQQGSTIGYPGAYPFVLAVAAVDRNGNFASFSNPGQTPESLAISAPGVDIASVRAGGGYVSMSGTSMATPVTSGILALYYGALIAIGRPIPTAEQLRMKLRTRAIDAGVPGIDRDFGPGIIRGDLLALDLIDDPPPVL